LPDGSPKCPIFEQYYDDCEKRQTTNEVDSGATKALLDLDKLLTVHKAPLVLFHKIQKWARESYQKYDYNVATTTNNVSREYLLKKVSEKYGLKDTEPYPTDLVLRGTKTKIKLVKKKLVPQIVSMLANENLMAEKNLLVNKDTGSLFGPPPEPSADFLYDDVNTGSVYRSAYKELCEKQYPDGIPRILLALILFADGTHTDFFGRLCLEPVTFTLSIFNRSARFGDDFWGIMGWLAKLKYAKNIHTAENKSVDYHHMLEVVISDIRELQENELGRFRWKVKDSNGELQDCIFKVFP